MSVSGLASREPPLLLSRCFELPGLSRYWLTRKHFAVQLLQPIEFPNPLLQRQTAHLRNINGSIEPVVGTALPKVEIPVAFVQVNVLSESSQFVIDRFERKAHVGTRHQRIRRTDLISALIGRVDRTPRHLDGSSLTGGNGRLPIR